MKKSLIALAMLAMSAAAPAAFAADAPGVYAFGTAGQQTLSTSVPFMSSSASQFQFGLGLPLTESLAFEASWLTASHHTDLSGLNVDYKGAILGLRTTYPVNDKLAITGKVGMTLLSVDIAGTDLTSDGSNFMVGIGTEYKLTPKTALTVNYEFMDKPADTTRNTSTFSVGMKYTF